MSLFELRETIESSIPWFAIPIFTFALLGSCLVYLYFKDLR